MIIILEPSFLFLSVLAVLNATLPEQSFPVDVDIRLTSEIEPEPDQEITQGGSEAAATAEPTGIGLDAVTIGSVVAIASGLVAAFRKNSAKVDAVADSTVNLSQSLKATDYGNKDTAQILANALAKLSNVKSVEEIPKALAECAPAAKQNAEAWNQDVQEYYENEAPTTSQDLGLDKTREKLVQVNKITERTPET
jgi:hypothetical protein